MALSAQEVRQILTAVRTLPMDAPSMRVEDFICSTLRLNTAQQGQMFPDPDPTGQMEIVIAHLTKERERSLRKDCSVPEFVIYQDAHQSPCIAGFDTYLSMRRVKAKLRGRLTHHRSIRTALRRMRNGHHLEAVAAAILKSECDYGEATSGSGDQGIDAIGWKQLVLIDPCFSGGDLSGNEVQPGEQVFLLASSKAFTGGGNGPPGLISPAHIRELVGGWVIQRSSESKWESVGIRMLSPVQMVLVTTYRLSPDAKVECRGLGVQIWGIPELIYLICVSAPDTVFDPAANHRFSVAGFNAWWRVRHQNRRMTT